MNALNKTQYITDHKTQFMTSIKFYTTLHYSTLHYSTQHDTLHMLHLDEIPLGSYKSSRCMYTYSRQTKMAASLYLKRLLPHTFNILMIPVKVINTQIGTTDLYSFVPVGSWGWHFGAKICRVLYLLWIVFYDLYVIAFYWACSLVAIVNARVYQIWVI
jgi:hypothetical protein